jgi:CheY-like chemotaxis protein
MKVVSTTTGRQAIELLQQQPDISVVLMDIMMPEMDGYQTTREIRKDPQFERLPIFALTAKAMKGDRDKCLAAGASDYVAKPVNTHELLSLLRVWLHR